MYVSSGYDGSDWYVDYTADGVPQHATFECLAEMRAFEAGCEHPAAAESEFDGELDLDVDVEPLITAMTPW